MQDDFPVVFTVDIPLLEAMAQGRNVTPATGKLQIPARKLDGAPVCSGATAKDEACPRRRVRLDAALMQAFPHLGVRGRRRLWEWCDITVNGKARPYGYMVCHGDAIAVVPADVASSQKVAHTSAINHREEKNNPQPIHCSRGELPSALELRTAADFAVKQPGVEDWLPHIRLIAMTEDFLVFYKPSGLHTVHLAGSASCSLESCLPEFMERHGSRLSEACHPQGGARYSEGRPENGGGAKGRKLPHDTTGKTSRKLSPVLSLPRLLTRLDRETSGLVLAARTVGAEKRFRGMEEGGLVRKTYVAVVTGLAGKGVVKQAIDMEKRRKSIVLAELADPVRWTEYEGVAPLVRQTGASGDSSSRPVTGVAAALLKEEQPSGNSMNEPLSSTSEYSLVRVVIRRGARHQIRAHLAFCGHPLVCDSLYGRNDGRACGQFFFLHYGRLDMPGLSAWCMPDSRWDVWKIPGV